MLSSGDHMAFVERPISGSIVVLALVIVVLMLWGDFRRVINRRDTT